MFLSSCKIFSLHINKWLNQHVA
ncbi:Sh3 domain YSC-like 1 (predicted), isoform CRA_b, partial [Rattus norvegicus]